MFSGRQSVRLCVSPILTFVSPEYVDIF